MPLITHVWLSCLLLAQTTPEAKPAARPEAAAIVAALETVVADSIESAQDSVVAISRIRRTETTP